MSKSTNNWSLIQYWLYTDMICNARILAIVYSVYLLKQSAVTAFAQLKSKISVNLGNIYNCEEL